MSLYRRPPLKSGEIRITCKLLVPREPWQARYGERHIEVSVEQADKPKEIWSAMYPLCALRSDLDRVIEHCIRQMRDHALECEECGGHVKKPPQLPTDL